MAEKTIYSVQSVERSLNLLEAIAGCENGIRIKDLAERENLHLSTAHRLVSLLEHRGYVEQEPESKKYFLGMKVLQLQGYLFKSRRLNDVAAQELKRIVYSLGETTHLAVLSEDSVVYIESLEGVGSVISRAPIGKKVHIYSTALGKALTAWKPQDEVERILHRTEMAPKTPNTITDVQAYLNELSKVKLNGYAVDRQEHSMISCCIAAPIRDHRNEVVAAVSVSCPAHDFTKESEDRIVRELMSTAYNISVKLGYSH
ncbi:IclR family transcriptional regulator [Paenibacillus hemerocallicola]|uniref:Glycerol operon regulatory protein n=1 Tax=Paenibacillus hemerocallicola TaxID=1172614 RepID=A0A5C4TAK3_9BACL|nr:IclR family transcriptional regulator [Paenibacillus hemerocallicola]TNJ66083.1 IclR family transcriptional regulator [Paenibacillus hemerocallicola]